MLFCGFSKVMFFAASRCGVEYTWFDKLIILFPMFNFVYCMFLFLFNLLLHNLNYCCIFASVIVETFVIYKK